MLKVYGSLLCPDCVACKKAYEEHGIPFEYHDFSQELPALKTFLKLRDTEPVFTEVKKEGKIGIPCIVREDGMVSLDWESFLSENM